MNRDALRPPGASHSSSITAQVGDAAFVVDNDAIHNSNVVQVSHGSHAYAGAGACAGEIYARFLLPEEAAAAESGVQAPWHTRSSPAQFGTCKVDVRRLVDLGLGSAVDEEESNQLRQQKVLLGKRKTACSSTDPLSEANESVSA
ncbi:hypothetical protein V6N13_002868 [Hibiscus sabdariffa]|uniref:Uncharacterized protein n=1 Tax=Hibiscus sabdariffa TaxID=183260 RepID=A0ABR2NY13_9ROSI